MRKPRAARKPGRRSPDSSLPEAGVGGSGSLLLYWIVSFPCPGCDQAVDASPERRWLRCRACGALLRARVAPSETGPAWDVEVRGAPETRRRVEVHWSPGEQRRLGRWLGWASAITLSLVVVLYLLAALSR